MNKEEFLNELRGHLRVLDEKEQQDIIDEYAQHIDLKMKSGLSEEDAICDFGNVEELAGDILEAYHVDPKFEEKTKGILIRKPDMEKVSKRTRKLVDRIRMFFDGVKEKLRGIKEASGRKWRAVKGETNSRDMEGKYEKRKNTPLWKGQRGTEGWGIGRRWLYNACVLIWNFICVISSFCLLGMAAVSLFGFGAILILVFSGYPLLGAELFCFGVATSGASLGLLLFSLRKSYRKRTVEGMSELAGEVE